MSFQIRGVASACVAATAFVLSGCIAAPSSTKSPAVDVPQTFSTPTPSPARPEPDATDLNRWWLRFNDSTLTELIDTALANNRDLRIAEARIREARAARRAVKGERWPNATVSAAVGESRPSATNATLQGREREFDDSATGEFEATWELDLWGRVRANVRAANADVKAARALLADTQLVTAVETAKTYLQLRGLQAQQSAARRGIALQLEVMQLTEVRASVGEADSGEAAAARAELRATEARLPQLEADKELVIASLSVLTGRPTDELRSTLATDTPIPTFAGIADVGVPATGLARRPDVRAAQAALTAADARIAAAVAAQFPEIRLGLRGSSVEESLSDAMSLPNFDLTRAVELRLPLFNRAAIYAEIDATDARREAALAEYERTLLRALADTEAALARCTQFGEARQALAEATASGSEAVRVATARYREGDESFLSVLIAQRDQLQRELSLSEGQVALAVEYVSLVQNLGAVE